MIEIRRNAPLIAFLILAVCGGFAIRSSAHNGLEALYRSQIQACERGNSVRAENNHRILVHQADTKVLKEFLAAAETARKAAYERNGAVEDRDAARNYASLITYLNEKVHFNQTPLVNCKKAIPKP
jgi:hypothetical protein